MNLHHIILSSPWETLYNEQCLLLVFHYKDDFMVFFKIPRKGVNSMVSPSNKETLS